MIQEALEKWIILILPGFCPGFESWDSNKGFRLYSDLRFHNFETWIYNLEDKIISRKSAEITRSEIPMEKLKIQEFVSIPKLKVLTGTRLAAIISSRFLSKKW